MKKVVVIVPIYKSDLSEFDHISLCRTGSILSNYPIVAIHPAGLDTSDIARRYPFLAFKAFPPKYFAGIMGYNRLMLSELLYEAFADYEYMLICQTDAYIFSDQLTEWCDAGYDYVGAPWLKRPVYNLPIIKQWMAIKRFINRKRGIPCKQDFYGKVGNGGLSLRRISTHLLFLKDHPDRVALYLNREKKNHLYNEDVFWATEPQTFTYPTTLEALRFSFDRHPAYAYGLTGGTLPMGCHAWYKRKMRPFWQKIAPYLFP